MDGRITSEATPAGRLAAVVQSVFIQMRDHEKKEPDYADFRDSMQPFLDRELILARMEELQKTTGATMTMRVSELAKQLVEVSAKIHEMSDRYHL